ncbi:MAG: prepilin-type N-terminal cleavage/methylation domain-containing protein [Serpentinimonas sp.]|jgi:prepilin-type N-terminal cleavage/methylation domain-containing protein|nr:prepilin-type N-terminal cleavage/methylation domain-containing protein [Serpentinimonas sp.]
MIPQSTQLARTSRGFSLVELMVALALGLVMIGAVVTVFVSNQESARIKQELDRAQEAFRFSSYTIMRVVQQGQIRVPNTTLSPPELLVVEISPGEGHRDCLGRTIGTGVSRNTFFIDGTRLLCRVESTGTTHALETIVDGIDASRTAFTTPTVRSVRVRLAMQSTRDGSIGPTALFSATMRQP